MAAALAKLWRTWSEILGLVEGRSGRFAESLGDAVGSELAGAWQVARQSALDDVARAQQSLDILLNNWLSVLNYEDCVVLVGQSLDFCFGQWVLRHFQNVGRFACDGLLHVVVGDAARDDDEFLAALLDAVERGIFGSFEHLCLLAQQSFVFLAGDAWQQHPLVGRWVHRVGVAHLADLDGGA